MYRNKWIDAICVVSILAAVSFAQSPAGQGTGAEGKEPGIETDAIFNEILESLPGELRAEVDSATRAGSPSLLAPDNAAIQKRAENRETARQQQLVDLPEPLRLQVEKTIDRMDENLQQRQMQFKEQNSETKGKK